MKGKWRSHQGVFKAEERKRKVSIHPHKLSMSISKMASHIQELTQVEADARNAIIEGTPTHTAPPLPKFRLQGPRKEVANQFRHGHRLYWKENRLEFPEVCCKHNF
eukprot:EG_transcript_27992